MLIGMPGAGKSTVGLALARACGMAFVDTDAIIQNRENRPLQEILDTEGVLGFRRIEEKHLLALAPRHTMVSTGGSVIFSDRARDHLRSLGRVVWIDAPLADIQQRLTNLATRGVVRWPGQTVEVIFRERRPLYQRWSDVRVSSEGKTEQQTVQDTLKALRALGLNV